MSIAGRGTVLVTGAGSGIGEAVARLFLERGWHTILAGRRLDRLQAIAQAYPKQGHAVEMDVADPASITAALACVPPEWRPIEVLVNNAGHDLGGRRRFDHGAIDDFVSTVETNLVGMMRVTHACVGSMLEAKRGHIVNIGSVAGQNVNKGGSAYSASKFGVNGFTKALIEDYKGTGVRVSQIMPGVVKTEFAKARLRGDEAGAEKFYSNFPVAMTPDDIARAVMFVVEQPAHINISELTIVTSA